MAKLISKFLMWLSGWKVDKNIPPEARRCVMVAAPHTSNWDAYYLRLAFYMLDLPMKVAIKDNWTKGILGFLIKPLGGVGIDRSPLKKADRPSQTGQMAALFDQYEDIALVIAPEGTRKRRDKWKKGFYWIAKEAGVPITFGYLDYKNRIAGVGPKALYPSANIEADMTILNDFYRHIKGKHPENYALDEAWKSPEA